MPDATKQVTVRFDLQIETDPLGARLSVSVPSAPSRDAREALLDGIEETLVGAQNNLVFQTIQEAHDRLEAYGSEHDYDWEPIAESLEFRPSSANRTDRGLTVAWHWTHEAAIFFEFGTSDHTVDGNPFLVFMFDAQQYPYLEDMFGDGPAVLQSVTVSGLPEGRWLRDSLHWLRREVGQT